MAGEIDLLRSRCDFLAVSMHWGQEYAHAPAEEQLRLAAFLADHLVDLVIGHHPHVLQPLEYLPRPDGKTTLCVYSLGNLISAHRLKAKPTVLGGLLYLRLIKNRAGLSIEEAGIIPVVTHFERDLSGFRIYPLYQYGEDLIRRHGLAETGLTFEYVNSLLENLYKDGVIPHNPFSAGENLRRKLPGAD
jgi:poly-gamma-glutamate synthesis protein (capsule biosynthesis protein)